MHYRITHAMVGFVAGALVIATILFAIVISIALDPLTGTEAAARPVIPPITHEVNESTADCAGCHVVGRGGMPPSHATYGADTCLTCHEVGEPPAGGEAEAAGQAAAAVPHPVAGPYANCVGCHAIGGNRSMPDNHASFTNATCAGCHATPAAEAGQPATIGAAGPVVPHDIDGQFVNCDSCHAFSMGDLAMPENHQGFTKETCTNCHQPAQ